MKEFTGQLIGGPDEGNFVTSSVHQIITNVTTEMKLEGNDADPDIIVTAGKYIWLLEKLHFKWVLYGSKTYTPKEYLEFVRNKYES